MIKVQNNIASREYLPAFLQGLAQDENGLIFMDNTYQTDLNVLYKKVYL